MIRHYTTNLKFVVNDELSKHVELLSEHYIYVAILDMVLKRRLVL